MIHLPEDVQSQLTDCRSQHRHENLELQSVCPLSLFASQHLYAVLDSFSSETKLTPGSIQGLG